MKWKQLKAELAEWKGGAEAKTFLNGWVEEYEKHHTRTDNGWRIRRKKENVSVKYRNARVAEVIVDDDSAKTEEDVSEKAEWVKIPYRPGVHSVVTIKLYRQADRWAVTEWRPQVFATRTLNGPLPMWLLKKDPKVGDENHNYELDVGDFPGP